MFSLYEFKMYLSMSINVIYVKKCMLMHIYLIIVYKNRQGKRLIHHVNDPDCHMREWSSSLGLHLLKAMYKFPSNAWVHLIIFLKPQYTLVSYFIHCVCSEYCMANLLTNDMVLDNLGRK